MHYSFSDVDIRLDPAQLNAVSQLRGLVNHELGHAIGLDHSDVSSAIMFANPYNTYEYQQTLNSDDIAGCVALYGQPANNPTPTTTPVCTLSVNPASVNAGSSATLSATCNPAATSYTWTGGSCTDATTSVCTVNPANTTSYTLKGSNSAGTGAEALATVYVCNAPPATDIAGTTITGNSSNELINSSMGSDTIDGAGGVNTVRYNCNRSNFTITATTTGFVASSVAEGFDKLSNVQRLQFADKTVALDINGKAGQAYRIYQAAFDRTPDAGGLKYWIGQMDNGMDLLEVAARFVDSNEFRSLYGTKPTNANFLTKLYNNVLHRTPEQGGYDWWLGELEAGRRTQTKALADFSESDENKADVLSVIQNGIELPN